MTDTALVSSTPAGLAGLAGALIRDPQDLAARLRAIEAHAHLVTPLMAVSAIAPGHAINVAVVVIDPSVDPKTGAGPDVYHQPSIHRADKVGHEWRPAEVSLGKTGLLKIAAAAGVTWIESRRLDDGRTPHYWAWTAVGEVTDFDGSRRRLVGSVEVDLRDGSAQIGGWTPEKWAERVREAEARRAKAPREDAWKIKPEPIGGWTEERVVSARRFGLRLAEAKAINAAIRTLGLRQKYTIEDLRKPFVVLRCSFVPDLADPDIKRLVTERALGGAGLLYPRPALAEGPPPRPEEEAVSTSAEVAAPAAPTDSAAPDDLETLPDLTPPRDEEMLGGLDLYHITFVGKRREGPRLVYLVRVAELPARDLETGDPALARAALAAYRANQPVRLSYERTGDGSWVLVEVSAAEANERVASAPPTRRVPLTVTDVQREVGSTAGRQWTRSTITLSDGREVVTFSTRLAEAAEAARAARAPVAVQVAPSKRVPDQLDLVDLQVLDTSQTTLPLGAPDEEG